MAKQSHVPFRDSKLTFLLQDSLGKDNKTLMIVQVNPMLSCRGESVCSLNFAQRVQKVELGKAKSHSDADEVAKARTAVSKARDELKAAQDEASEAIEKLQRAHQEDAATIESLKNQLTYVRVFSVVILYHRDAVIVPGRSSVTSSSAQLTAVQLEVKALISKLAASEAVNAALTSELQSLRSQPAQVITVPATVDTDALIADAVAKVKAEAEEEKKTAVNAAVEAVKRAAQEQLSKKRQMRANERISIIGANVPSAIAVPPPGAPMPSIIPSITPTASSVGKAPTPFKPTVAVPTEDESDVEDEVQPAGKPRIPAKGTPAKGLAVESEDEEVDDGEHDEFEDTWTSGLDAFTGKLSFTSDGSVKPILKAAPVSRVESIRSIARSLSTIGLPPKTLAGPALITKQKKKVTFISPNNSTTLKREREDGVAQPAISEPAGVPIEAETVTVDENSGPTVPKKAAFHTPRVPAKKIKIFG